MSGMARNLVLTALVVAGSSGVLYIIYLHQSLSHRIKHSSGLGLPNLEVEKEKGNDDEATAIDSLPAELAEDPSAFHIIHDIAWKSVPTAKLPTALADHPEQLLNRYLRRNMACFGRTPQALLMRLLVWTKSTTSNSELAKAGQTFDVAHIQNLDFVPGDVVCGIYRVQARTAARVEFAMVPLPIKGMPPIDGRLVTGVQRRTDKDTLFLTQTVQWKRRDVEAVLPLERKPVRWLHELVSWWLLETGIQWLLQCN